MWRLSGACNAAGGVEAHTTCCQFMPTPVCAPCMQERAGRLVAGAMRALLPAVDANDEAKTLAVLRFFCVVLSSVPRLEVPVGLNS